MYYTLFICSPVDDHLGYLQFGAFKNKAPKDIFKSVLRGQMFSFLSNERLGIELLSHRVDTSFTSYKTTRQFSKVMVAMRSLFNTSGNRAMFDVVQHC